MEQIIQTIAVYAIPVLFAITLHEAAHGYVARMYGDHTAAMMGRITLNPLKHIDPIGTIAVPLLILLTSKAMGGPSFLFGWAKPVPVNFGNLKNPKRDMIPVAAAGPGVNLLMAIAWAILAKILVLVGVEEKFFLAMCQAGIVVNIGLMALNLLPLPPLDGGRILVGLLPHNAAVALSRVEPFGMWILIALLVTGTLGFFLAPFYAVGFWIINLFS
ncbi:MAG: site-2 protease family protein [Burkholderiaceae bacterium]